MEVAQPGHDMPDNALWQASFGAWRVRGRQPMNRARGLHVGGARLYPSGVLGYAGFAFEWEGEWNATVFGHGLVRRHRGRGSGLVTDIPRSTDDVALRLGAASHRLDRRPPSARLRPRHFPPRRGRRSAAVPAYLCAGPR